MAINRFKPPHAGRMLLWPLALLVAAGAAAGASDPHARSLQQAVQPLPEEIPAPAGFAPQPGRVGARPGIRFERTVSISADGSVVYGCRQTGGHDFREPRLREEGQEMQR